MLVQNKHPTITTFGHSQQQQQQQQQMSESKNSTEMKPTVTRRTKPTFRQSTTTKPTINPKSTKFRPPGIDNMALLVHGFANQYSNNPIPFEVKTIIADYYHVPVPIAYYPKITMPLVTWDDTILFGFSKHTDEKKIYLVLEHDMLHSSYLNETITMDNCLNVDFTITTTQPIVVAPLTNISPKKQQAVPKTVSLGVVCGLPDGPPVEPHTLIEGFDPVKKKLR